MDFLVEMQAKVMNECTGETNTEHECREDS